MLSIDNQDVVTLTNPPVFISRSNVAPSWTDASSNPIAIPPPFGWSPNSSTTTIQFPGSICASHDNTPFSYVNDVTATGSLTIPLAGYNITVALSSLVASKLSVMFPDTATSPALISKSRLSCVSFTM